MDARQVAFRVLRRVDEGSYANLALDGESQRARLSPLDRRLASALVYGVLKGRARLDYALSSLTPRGLDGLDPATRDLLRLGALQILELRTPAHAAVDQTVDALRKLRGAKLAGASFTRSDLRGAKLGPLTIGDGRFVRTDFTRAVLRGADLRGAHAHRARFLEADMHGANMAGCDLTDAELEV